MIRNHDLQEADPKRICRPVLLISAFRCDEFETREKLIIYIIISLNHFSLQKINT